MSGKLNGKRPALPAGQPILDTQVRNFLNQCMKNGEPSPHELDPLEARRSFDRLQSGMVAQAPVDMEDLVLNIEPTGRLGIRIVRPAGSKEPCPIIFYLHGGAWVAGNTGIYDRLLRDLAAGTRAAVVFIDYTLAPEASYPVQIEEAYAALCEIVGRAQTLRLDGTRIAVVGDCSGGNMAAALTLLAKRRRGPEIALQVLLYPILAVPKDISAKNHSPEEIWLSAEALKARFDIVFPDEASRQEITAFPFNASQIQLNDLPQALVVVAEHDIVRDGAEEYARHLTEAGVIVTCTRYNGVIHDFMLLNALCESPTTRSAWVQVTETLHGTLLRGAE